jgi:hypothetical protein
MAEFLVMSPKADSIGGFLMLCFLFTAVTFGSNNIILFILACSLVLWKHVYRRTIAQGWVRGVARQTWLWCHIESVSDLSLLCRLFIF